LVHKTFSIYFVNYLHPAGLRRILKKTNVR